MNHLTIDEILDFVTLTELNKDTVELAATVNGHIGKCKECLETVRSFQIIYDEFRTLSSGVNFRDYVQERTYEIEADR